MVIALSQPFMIGPKRGAVPLVTLAAAPELAGITGKYFARWPLSGIPGAKVKPHRPSRAGRDAASARRLWDESERMIAGAER